MAKLLKLRRGTTSQHGSFTGAEGEVTVDTDKESLVVHNGSTAGGFPLARENMSNVASASITGRLSSGAIAGAKIANGAITSAHIAADTVVAADIAANAVGTSEIADDAVTTAQIADDAVTTACIADDAITAPLIADNSIHSALIQNATINQHKIGNNEIVRAKIAADAVDGTKIADDSIDSEHIAADSIDSEHYAPNSVDADALAHTSVTAGSYGSATAIPAITVDAQGRITAASTNTVNTTTNLGVNRGQTQCVVTSSTGTDATIGEATSSDSGVMSSAHHDKLDGIESGATADQSNAEIRAAVEAASDSNVFTDADHTKLNGIASSANNYSHPSHPGDDFSIDTGHLSGATVIDDIDINVTTDGSGHVTDCNGTVATRNLTLGDLGYTGATNANYITNNNQLSNGAGYLTTGGKVLQVTQHAKTNTSLLNGNQNTMVEVDSAFRESITPSATNHKVLITFAITGGGNWQGGTPRVRVQVSIGGGGWSDVSPLGESSGNRTRCHMVIGSLGDSNQAQTMSMTLLHSPSTTSSCNYRFLIGGDVSNNNFHWNRSGGDGNNFLGFRSVSTITLMEISN